MRRFIHPLPLLALVLAGCGGSGGDSGTPPPSASFPITSANAQAASAKAWQAANDSASYAELAGTGGIISSSPGGFTKVSAVSSGWLPRVLEKIPFGPETFACLVSGTVTYSGDIADATTLTAGDVVNAEFDACDDGAGAVIDGALSMTIDAFSGDLAGGAYAITLTIELSDFQASVGNEAEVANGAITVSLDTTSLPVITASVGGDGLTVDANAATFSLTNFLAQQSVDTEPFIPTFTFVASGTLDTSELPGSVTYTTPTEFEGLAGEYPYAGALRVAGENSAARLVAIDNVNVRIDVDADGDGNYESNIDTTWSELDD